jgi:hypothetical protein
MKRPRIELRSEEQVAQLYNHYLQDAPSRVISNLAWRAFDGIYRPWIEYCEGAEEELHNLRDNNVSQIFAFNHLTNIHDQFNSAAILMRHDPETAGWTRVLTKDPVIRSLNKIGGIADKLGGIPAFRKKDNGNGALVDFANEKMFDTVAWMLRDKENLAIYPEGTHNKNDPSRLGTVRSGIGEIATRTVALGAPVAITPIGMAYGRIGKWHNPLHATAIIGNPFVISPEDTVESVTESTKNRLQHVVTIAHNKHSVL